MYSTQHELREIRLYHMYITNEKEDKNRDITERRLEYDEIGIP